METLSAQYDTLSRLGYLKRELPSFLLNSLNPRFRLRPYQVEALARFIHYLEEYPEKKLPVHLLFNMATGSGKTLVMAATILYLYSKGYRNFLFFVNSTNIIEKTRNNFLNPLSSKYLFNQKIEIDGVQVAVREVSNFEGISERDVNILFTTVQGLHSQLTLSRENGITMEDFRDKKIVLISDEAHHINAWTRASLTKTEEEMRRTWEHTVMGILHSNPENLLLEFTATLDLENRAIYEKYKDKLIFVYDLKRFRLDGYSKEIKVLQADLENDERMLQAVVLSQYRKKIAQRHGIRLKPVVLFKSRNIKESKENYEAFRRLMDDLTERELREIRAASSGTVLERAFNYFEEEGITLDNLALELKEDFSEERTLLLDSENIDREKQIKLNTLEDEDNEIRAIFAVRMLDEGWDVLNLFDIVRLYDTRDGRWTRDGRYVPGKTTIAERQLIGRGARYYPFKVKEGDDPFRRKFDAEPDNPLRILEELHYHSKHNPRYIQELTAALKEWGLMPQDEREVHLRVKESFKRSELWQRGVILLNRKVEARRDRIRSLEDLGVRKTYAYNLPAGFVEEGYLLEDGERSSRKDTQTKVFTLGEFGEAVIRRAMAKLDFYSFNNLKRYFPGLSSSSEFVNSLKGLSVSVSSSAARLSSLTPEDRLKISLSVLRELQEEILKETLEFEGTKEFYPVPLREVVRDRILKIAPDFRGEGEFGFPMSNPKREEYRLNLREREWFVYDEDYGTSDEKSFIKVVDGLMEELKEKFEEVYLLRNAGLFKLYSFKGGRALEPDFLLLLRREEEVYQLFIEVKGAHLEEKDRWKEEFLTEIEETGRPVLKNYRVIGLPFYGKERKGEFVRVLREKLGI